MKTLCFPPTVGVDNCGFHSSLKNEDLMVRQLPALTAVDFWATWIENENAMLPVYFRSWQS